jgi:hypothetical protein
MNPQKGFCRGWIVPPFFARVVPGREKPYPPENAEGRNAPQGNPSHFLADMVECQKEPLLQKEWN